MDPTQGGVASEELVLPRVRGCTNLFYIGKLSDLTMRQFTDRLEFQKVSKLAKHPIKLPPIVRDKQSYGTYTDRIRKNREQVQKLCRQWKKKQERQRNEWRQLKSRMVRNMSV